MRETKLGKKGIEKTGGEKEPYEPGAGGGKKLRGDGGRVGEGGKIDEEHGSNDCEQREDEKGTFQKRIRTSTKGRAQGKSSSAQGREELGVLLEEQKLEIKTGTG